MDMSLSKLREARRAVVHGVAKSWTRLSDWTELNWTAALRAFIDLVWYLFVDYVFLFTVPEEGHSDTEGNLTDDRIKEMQGNFHN